MISLNLTFVASDGSRKTVTVSNVDADITGARVEEAMNHIINANIVGKDEVRYYTRIYTAKIVQTTSTTLLDYSKEPIIAA